MKPRILQGDESGSVLIISILTITVMTLICATSLYITSQNANITSQAAAYQQALAGAESGVDQAISALNTNTWTGWQTFNGSVPNGQPVPGGTPAPPAAGKPASGTYNYASVTISPQIAQYNVANSVAAPSEGSSTVSHWTTVETGGMPLDSNGNQWYRIRSTGTAAAPGPARVSNQGMDIALRKIGLRFDRKSSSTVSTPQATRTIEVIVQAVSQSPWARGITMKNWVSMSGSGTVDSFNSSDPFKSTSGQFDPAKRQNHGDIGVANSTGSDLRNTFVYGSLAYSGPAVKNTTNVQGAKTTPFTPSIPNTTDPNWTGKTITTYSAKPSNGILTAGTSNAPTYYKITGDLITSSSGAPILLQKADTSANNTMYIWVAGKLTTSGSGFIQQDSNVKVVWFVDKDITVSGSSYLNQSGLAANVDMTAVGTGKITISGSGTFIGAVNAPGYDVTVSGGASYSGAIIGNTLTISGSGSFHYDEALNAGGGGPSVGNYAFASWFEDTR